MPYDQGPGRKEPRRNREFVGLYVYVSVYEGTFRGVFSSRYPEDFSTILEYYYHITFRVWVTPSCVG